MTARPSIPPRIQFSLRWLLATVTIVAVLLGSAIVAGHALLQLAIGLFCLVLPTPFVIAVFYDRGDYRAFSLGVLVIWLAVWSEHGLPGSIHIVEAVLHLFLGGVSGAVAVATRRWLARQN